MRVFTQQAATPNQESDDANKSREKRQNGRLVEKAINSLLLATAIAKATIDVANATDITYTFDHAPSESEVSARHEARWQAVKNWPVPLPAHTPFDRNHLLRAAYLEGFCSGYRSALTGVIASYWPIPQTSETRRQGLMAGQVKAVADHPQVLVGKPPIREATF